MTADSPNVSILMNCFNGEKYLHEAVESVLQQTYQDWELIFWDNQSTDRSSTIVQAYDDPRINYHLAPRHTDLAVARRLASDKALGSWIGFLDCDDIWFTHKLQKQFEAISDADISRIGLIYSHAEIRCSDGAMLDKDPYSKYRQHLPTGNIFRSLIQENFIPLPSLLVNKRAYDSVGGFTGEFPFAEDYYLTLRLSKSYEALAVNEPLCVYRLHPNNASRSYEYEAYFEQLAIVRRFYPGSGAFIATARILVRYLLTCLRARNSPSVPRIFKSLHSGNIRS